MELSETCKYKFTGEQTKCSQPNYQNEKFCIFHFDNVEQKKQDFTIAFENYIMRCEENVFMERYDFRGFVFPEISFKGKEFYKIVDFSSSKFVENTFFEKSQFNEAAVFRDCVFSRFAWFHLCKFYGNAVFNGCKFSGNVDFGESIFSYYAHFFDIEFLGNSTFYKCAFKGIANFSQSKFINDVDFSQATFWGYSSFNNACFLNRVDFFQANFNEEIKMNESHFTFMKNLKASGINFENSVLESAHLWKIDKLEDYSFKNSFLLSISFANKRFINCNFTGALFDAVHTRGWQPDDKTLKNTKYIYTNYSKDEDGNLTVDPESRVPADGNFGEGEHKDFTIAHYLREPIKWSFALKLPLEIRTGITNYIQFFKDFVRITLGVEVEIRSKKEGGRIRVEFEAENEDDKKVLKGSFVEFMRKVFEDTENLNLEIRGGTAKVEEIEKLQFKMENNIKNLQMELKLEKYLNLSLKEDKSDFKEQNKLLARVIESIEQKSLPEKTTSEKCDVNTFALFADLAGFSKATAEDESIHKIIQDFFLKERDEIEPKDGVEEVKSNGDDIIAFGLDGMSLVWVAEDLINDFQKLKRDFQDFPIKGFRVVLGYGTCTRQKVGDKISFSGNPIIDTARVDQPMKRYIQENNEDLNQIWCTEDFKDEMTRRGEKRISFEELPEMDLAKGYEKKFKLFRVK
ncbi:MAG: hypothetical protein DWQ06_10625 [Calditrichaeota bacterium]|nr:MAG: hypothetical protein DWQ06_10625 [Calditrichota bacterium]